MNKKTANDNNTRTRAVLSVMDDPIRNRRVAFSAAEREALGLTGRLPSGVLDLEQQARRVYRQLQAQDSDLAKNVYLEQLHDRNEVLYYRVLADHLAELLPVVYDPTVGDAIEQYSHEYRRPRGVFLSIDRPDEIERALRQARASSGIIALETVVEQVKPTILIGASTAHGAFTRQVVEAMSARTPRPVIFPISNPTSQIEAMPAYIVAWSKGQALVATGLPIPPVDYQGIRYWIGQANNALLYPGLGLGTIVSGASKVTDGMLLAAAEAVAGQADVSAPGASLLPAVENLRASSATTAIAVARAAADDGVATSKPDNLVQAVQDAMWQPAYPDGAV